MNPNIATTTNSPFQLHVVCRNIANAKRDEDKCNLWDRLPLLVSDIKQIEKLDVLILLEAGRSSKGHCWTEIAWYFEKETGLRYEGIKRLNASDSSFGKAVFINPRTVAIARFEQIWTELSQVQEKSYLWCGPHYGCDVILLECHPVLDSLVVLNKHVKIAAVHFPMEDNARISAAHWVASVLPKYNVDLVMGDFNTFEDRLGPEMKVILAQSFTSCIDSLHAPITFRGFDHDTITLRNDKLALLPECDIVERGLTECKVVPAGWLDHIYRANDMKNKTIVGRVYPPLVKVKAGSDHAQMHATVVLQ